MIYGKVLCDAQFGVKLADRRQDDPNIALGQSSTAQSQSPFQLGEKSETNRPKVATGLVSGNATRAELSARRRVRVP